MRVLVVGGGGREHALAWACAPAATVFCAPGNPGTSELGTNLPIAPEHADRLVEAIREHRIDLTVIGPEAPLAAGLADRIRQPGFAAFGPGAAAARIEASKAYSKEVMARAGVPTAESETFTERAAALDYIDAHPEPLVVKACGLAAGKGAVVCETRSQARDAATAILGGRFGEAGSQILVEEFLEGEEVSVLALTDGEHFQMLPAAQDHKRLSEGDRGPNTGGMGAYAPVSIATDRVLRRVADQVIRPTLRQLADDGAPYSGVLYAGIMLRPDGTPAVLEFNCRFGDPEAQVVLPLCGWSLVEHMWSIATGEPWRPDPSPPVPERSALTTVVAAPGYPDSPRKGAPIRLPESPPEGSILFHAGTRLDPEGVLRVAGGRVLCATGLGRNLAEAREASLRLASLIEFEGKVLRRDIGWREVERAGAP